MPKNEYKSGSTVSSSFSPCIASVCRPIWVDNFTVCWQLRWIYRTSSLSSSSLLCVSTSDPDIGSSVSWSPAQFQQPLSWHLHALLAAIKHQERSMQSPAREGTTQEQLLRWTLLWFKHAFPPSKWLPCQLVYGSLCRTKCIWASSSSGQVWIGFKWVERTNRVQRN